MFSIFDCWIYKTTLLDWICYHTAILLCNPAKRTFQALRVAVNDELTIDAIFHKEARKALARCNVKDVQSIKLNANNEKGRDYSDGSHKVALYLNKGEVFLLSLDEKMLTMLKRYIRNIEQ